MDCINLDGDNDNVDDMVGIEICIVVPQMPCDAASILLPSGSSTQSEVGKNGRRRQITPKEKTKHRFGRHIGKGHACY